MDIIGPDRILTVVLFLGALVAFWFLVRANRAGLRARLTAGRRMEIAETLALPPSGRAMILRVDGRDYLVVATRGAPPAVAPLASGDADRRAEGAA